MRQSATCSAAFCLVGDGHQVRTVAAPLCRGRPRGDPAGAGPRLQMPKRIRFATTKPMRRCSQSRPACLPSLLPSSLLAAEPESADLRYFRELVETRNYSLGQPVSPKITPDGKAVIFLRGGARDPVLRLYEFTIADAKLREILTPEKLLQGAEEKLRRRNGAGASANARVCAASPASSCRKTAANCWSRSRASCM